MRPPHPWLARLGSAGVILGLLAGLAAVGLTLLPMGPGGDWYGGRVAQQWQGVGTAGQAWAAVVDQFEEVAVTAVSPAAWVLVAGLLRLTASGRVRWAGPLHPLLRLGRGPAAAGMAFAGLSLAVHAGLWYQPGVAPPLPVRIHEGLDRGLRPGFVSERQPGYTSWGPGRVKGLPPPGPGEDARRLAEVACGEGYGLFRPCRPSGLLLFACGIVYCLATPRRDPEEE